MTPAEIEAGIVAYLRGVGPEKSHTGVMRREIGCTAAELKAGIERMRMRGKIQWDRLALSASMIEEFAPDAPVRESAPSGPMSTVSSLDVDGGCDPEGVAGEGGGGLSPPPPEPAADMLAARAHLLSAPDQLLRDVDAWCRRTSTKETLIGAILFRHPGFIGLLRARRTTGSDRIRAVRELMEANPDGLREADRPKHNLRVPKAPASASVPPAVGASEPIAAPARDIGAEVARESEERARSRRAARSGTVRNADEVKPEIELRRRIPRASALELGELSTIEKLQTLLVEDPEDLIRAVGRKHAALWRRCIALGRVLEQRPALVLYRALAAGLDVIGAELNGERVDG